MALRNAEFDGREIRLSLASHPGKAIKAEGDICLICCCASDLTLGPESEAVVITYEMTTGKLKRNPCGQNVFGQHECHALPGHAMHWAIGWHRADD